mgnify:CR=1 FL=1|jgi:hypothetical protein
MSDKEEIMSLLNRYSHTIDGGDVEGFVALFAKGEWYVEGTPPNRGAEEVRENVVSKVIIYPDGTPRTRHVSANIELNIDEAGGTANGQRYVTVLQQTDKLPLQAIFSGHYHDEFVKDGGEWRFAKTVVHGPFVGDMSQHLKSEDFIDGGSA